MSPSDKKTFIELALIYTSGIGILIVAYVFGGLS